MKKTYRQPELVEFGALASLTLGNNGCLLDNENQYDMTAIPLANARTTEPTKTTRKHAAFSNSPFQT